MRPLPRVVAAAFTLFRRAKSLQPRAESWNAYSVLILSTAVITGGQLIFAKAYEMLLLAGFKDVPHAGRPARGGEPNMIAGPAPGPNTPVRCEAKSRHQCNPIRTIS